MRTGGLGAGLIAVCLWGLAPVATRSLVHELARSLRSLRQCYAGTANRRLREALVREARDIVRRVCGFDVELP